LRKVGPLHDQELSSSSDETNPQKIIPMEMGVHFCRSDGCAVVGGFPYAANMESHDTFCGSCHTQPESTYLNNSTATQPADLASYHARQKTRCIDCHSGQGLFGRIQAEALGATNAIKWYSGTAIQPAPLTQSIGDGNCLKCH
jgi:hypothetical protein